jgi:vancomycin resistance protein YoaR
MKAKRGSALKLSYKRMEHRYSPKHPRHVDSKDYNKILNKFFEKLAYYLITTGEEIIPFSFIGSFQILKYKSQKKYVDHKATKDYFGETNKEIEDPKKRKRVMKDNRITGYYMPKIYWKKQDRANFLNKSKYSFKLTRPNIRPNNYNKNNPKVSLVPFFKEKGWIIYKEYNPTLRALISDLKKQKKNN